MLEHTTDSHGQTLVTFSMFDLVDKRLSPRIAKLTEKQLYRPRPPGHYKQWPRAGPLLRHHAQIDVIDAQWDDLLRIGALLNRGEALNDLRRFIFFANRGTIRYSGHEDQTTQAHSHTLVVNLCVLSTTGYLNDAIDAQRADGHPVSSEAIANLSPGQFETINPHGTLNFDITTVLTRPQTTSRP